MRLFDDIIGELRELVGSEQARGRIKGLPIRVGTNWPPAGDRNIICSSCDYRQVCSEVDDLRAMRASLLGKARAGR